MSETTNLMLPLLQAAQAQKHVTVNEALLALDSLVQASVLSRTVQIPPSAPADGDRYLLPAGVQDAWAGEDGTLAVWRDGLWQFHHPREDWRVHVRDEGRTVTYAAGRWRVGEVFSPFGAATVFDLVHEEHVIVAGSHSETAVIIPERSILLGVTGLVSQEITGPPTFSVGVAADPQRFGNGIGTGVNSQLNSVVTPYASYTGTAVRLTADGADFTGGRVQLCAHIVRMQIPDFL